MRFSYDNLLPRSRKLLIASLLGGLAAGGCARSRPSITPDESLHQSASADDGLSGQAVAASALVFDAPVAADQAPIFLSRADRQPAAFFGYDEGSIEYYRLTVDDQQLGLGGGGWGSGRGGRGGLGWGGGSGWYDRYERRAYSERVGAIRR